MRFFQCYCVSGASAIALISFALVAGSQESGFDECLRQKKIAAAIAALGDDDFHTREAASKELKAIGLPAYRELVRATWSDDPEVRIRAEDLLAPGKEERAAALLKRLEKGVQLTQKPTLPYNNNSFYCYFSLKFESAGIVSTRSEVEVESAETDASEPVDGIFYSSGNPSLTGNQTGDILVWVTSPKKAARSITVKYRLPVLLQSEFGYVEAEIPQIREERFRDGVISVERKALPGGFSEEVIVNIAVRSQHFREKPTFLLWKEGGPKYSHQVEEQPSWAGRKFVLTVLLDVNTKSGPDRLLMTYARETRTAELRGKLVVPVPQPS